MRKKVLVMGVIGADVHAVGNRILLSVRSSSSKMTNLTVYVLSAVITMMTVNGAIG